MSGDFMLAARRGVMARMKHTAGITTVVPPGSIYGGTVPAERIYPFTRIGSIIGTPFRASGLNSSSFRLTVNGFTQGVRVDPGNPASPLATTAEDHAHQIASAIKDGLDETNIVLETGGTLRLTWVRTITIQDGDDSSAWGTSVIFGADLA